MLDYEISRTVEVVPTAVATAVVVEDDYRWNVKCEHPTCTNAITVAKRSYIPDDFKAPVVKGVLQTTYTLHVMTAPEARRCSLHGPALAR